MEPYCYDTNYWCPPNFGYVPYCPVPGPTYKVNVGLSSETLLVGVQNYGNTNAPFYVTQSISGINALTTVIGGDRTGFSDGPANFNLVINPHLVGVCRPSKVVATLIYTQVIPGIPGIPPTSGQTFYNQQKIDLPYGTNSKTITFKFSGTDVYNANISNVKVVLQYT